MNREFGETMCKSFSGKVKRSPAIYSKGITKFGCKSKKSTNLKYDPREQ